MTKRFWWSAIGTFFVFLATIPELLKIPLPIHLEPYVVFTTAIFASIVQFYGGGHFYKAAISGIKTGTTSMDTLIVLGTSVAYGYSVFHFIATLLNKASGLPKAMFFDSSTVIITLVLLGKLMETRAKSAANTALREISKLESPTGHKVLRHEIRTVPIEQIEKNDILEIRPGERIPVDGYVVDGVSSVNESMLTGEPIPVTKKTRDLLVAGTMNGTGVLRMSVTAIGKDTVLSHIQTLVRDAQNAKPNMAKLADQISAVFVPVILGIAAVTALFWFATGHSTEAIRATIAVLVVACPCALGLATPMAIVVGIGRAAKAGVLIRTARTLEQTGAIRHIVFDKTGTITQGKPQVVDALILHKRFLPAILALESASEHPLANALLAWGSNQNIVFQRISTNGHAEPGKGIRGSYRGNDMFIGTAQFLSSHKIPIHQAAATTIALWEKEEKTIVCAAYNKTLVAVFAVDDPVRTEAATAITLLKKMKMDVTLLTGDRYAVAKAKATNVGISNVIAEVKPEGKSDALATIRKQNSLPIMMIGDGINDAPALAAADVSAAIGTGSAIAKATADMTVLANNLTRIPFMIILSRAVVKTMKQNLAWAFGYNIVLIPIATGALSAFGITLTPQMAAFAMAASSLSVVLNSLRLSRINIARPMA